MYISGNTSKLLKMIDATENIEYQYLVLNNIFNFNSLNKNNLSHNGLKYIFPSQYSPFWGIRFTKDGIIPFHEEKQVLHEMELPKRGNI